MEDEVLRGQREMEDGERKMEASGGRSGVARNFQNAKTGISIDPGARLSRLTAYLFQYEVDTLTNTRSTRSIKQHNHFPYVWLPNDWQTGGPSNSTGRSSTPGQNVGGIVGFYSALAKCRCPLPPERTGLDAADAQQESGLLGFTSRAVGMFV